MTLKEVRERDGMTQAEMAQKLGCSVSTVGRWESGRAAPRALLRGYIRHVLQAPELEWAKKRKRKNPFAERQVAWNEDGSAN